MSIAISQRFVFDPFHKMSAWTCLWFTSFEMITCWKTWDKLLQYFQGSLSSSIPLHFAQPCSRHQQSHRGHGSRSRAPRPLSGQQKWSRPVVSKVGNSKNNHGKYINKDWMQQKQKTLHMRSVWIHHEIIWSSGVGYSHNWLMTVRSKHGGVTLLNCVYWTSLTQQDSPKTIMFPRRLEKVILLWSMTTLSIPPCRIKAMLDVSFPWCPSVAYVVRSQRYSKIGALVCGCQNCIGMFLLKIVTFWG